MQRAVYVIGISGVSNGGKTTLTQRLHQAFLRSHYAGQDQYYVEEGNEKLEIDPELNHVNWESLSALDMQHMSADLSDHIRKTSMISGADEGSCTASPHLVFVEGYTIFNYRPMCHLWSKQYFLTLSKQEAQERRSHRVYYPADPPHYFDKWVWPMYKKHKEELKEQREIVYMDGTSSPDVLYSQIYGDVRTLIWKQ